MEYEISFNGQSQGVTNLSVWYSLNFQVNRNSKYMRSVSVRISELLLVTAVAGSGIKDPSVVVMEIAFMRWAVNKVEAAVIYETKLFAEETASNHIIEFLEADLATLSRDLKIKSCTYKLPIRRDLYCATPAKNDETAREVSPNVIAAPTSEKLCQECELPPSEILCSRLHHPQVIAVQAIGSWNRMLSSALCDIGSPKITSPEKCHASGNDCWIRTVQVGGRSAEDTISSLAIPEQLDFLNTAWRSRFGNAPLLKLRRVLDTVGLSRECHSRADFDKRVAELADVMTNWDISIDLIGDDLVGDQRNGSLNRLESVLVSRLDDDRDGEVISAIKTLRNVISIRTGLTHSGADNQLRQGFVGFGLSYPPASWSDAWTQIRIEVSDSLTTLRNIILDLPEEPV